MAEKIKAAVLGSGIRSKVVLRNLLYHAANGLEISAIYDPDKEVVKALINELKLPTDTAITDSAEEAIDFPGVQWVLVFSPNSFHCEHIQRSFAAGKHVFSEKPLATTIEDCQAIHQAHQQSDRLFATGFVLRYTPIYRKVKEILDSGVLGNIMSIEANENITPAHGGYIMTNWRRKRDLAGPHILEKCCHDLDLIEWFTGSLPSKVTAFADRKFFVKENSDLLKKHPQFVSWSDPHRIESPFNEDNDMEDMLFSVAEFRNKVQVSFSATMCNTIPERRMRFHCQYGTLIVELYSMTIRYKILGEDEVRVITFDAGSGHGGGDGVITAELWDSMQNNTVPVCSGNEGLSSAVYALALDKAAHEGKIIDLEPVWEKLGK